MQCLFCKKRLSMFRSFMGEQFCSEDHEFLYKREQQQVFADRILGSEQAPPLFENEPDSAPSVSEVGPPYAGWNAEEDTVLGGSLLALNSAGESSGPELVKVTIQLSEETEASFAFEKPAARASSVNLIRDPQPLDESAEAPPLAQPEFRCDLPGPGLTARGAVSLPAVGREQRSLAPAKPAAEPASPELPRGRLLLPRLQAEVAADAADPEPANADEPPVAPARTLAPRGNFQPSPFAAEPPSLQPLRRRAFSSLAVPAPVAVIGDLAPAASSSLARVLTALPEIETMTISSGQPHLSSIGGGRLQALTFDFANHTEGIDLRPVAGCVLRCLPSLSPQDSLAPDLSEPARSAPRPVDMRPASIGAATCSLPSARVRCLEFPPEAGSRAIWNILCDEIIASIPVGFGGSTARADVVVSLAEERSWRPIQWRAVPAVAPGVAAAGSLQPTAPAALLPFGGVGHLLARLFEPPATAVWSGPRPALQSHPIGTAEVLEMPVRTSLPPPKTRGGGSQVPLGAEVFNFRPRVAPGRPPAPVKPRLRAVAVSAASVLVLPPSPAAVRPTSYTAFPSLRRSWLTRPAAQERLAVEVGMDPPTAPESIRPERAVVRGALRHGSVAAPALTAAFPAPPDAGWVHSTASLELAEPCPERRNLSIVYGRAADLLANPEKAPRPLPARATPA